MAPEVFYLRYKISNKYVKAIPEKVLDIVNGFLHVNVLQSCSFIALLYYSRSFLPNVASTLEFNIDC